MKVIHCNFSTVKHGFRDNEVFCKPDITSSWFGRQGTLHAIFHDGFWKRDCDFIIVFHGNVFSGIHGLRDNEVLLQAEYDIIVILSDRKRFRQIFITDSERATMTAWKCPMPTFSSGIHGFRDNEVLLPTIYDVIVISPLEGASGNLLWRIQKERPWLPNSVPW